jgi:L-amino acid N-acyltransferase YncA
MEIRMARLSDAEGIRAIYNVEVTTSTSTFDLTPRTLAEQEAWLREHAGAYPAIVAVENGEVIGFGALSPFRDRPAYATTVEDSVYVRADWQGRGVGKALLTELLRLAAAHGFHAVIARIGGHNDASIALHRSCGFEIVGVEREVGRKFGRWLDVVEMQRLV